MKPSRYCVPPYRKGLFIFSFFANVYAQIREQERYEIRLNRCDVRMCLKALLWIE